MTLIDVDSQDSGTMATPEKGLLADLALLPVPGGTATIGLEEGLAAKFTRSYGEIWREFYYRETPQHTLSIRPFALARYPITNQQFTQFIEADGYQTPEFWTPEGWAWRQRTNRTHPHLWHDGTLRMDNRPAVGITWFEAYALTQWASLQTGIQIRLPSEAEWEWAARGENARWLYPWGGTFNPDVLNSGVPGISGEIFRAPIAVGTFSPRGDGPFGHTDQLGQVWEWTSTTFAPYPYDGADGREDHFRPDRRVLRGGSWGDGKYANRVTTRLHYPPNFGDQTSGFRVAADLDRAATVGRPQTDLVVYGRSSFCPDLVTVKALLHGWGVPYRQINIDLDEEAAFRLDDWLGARVVPTLVIAQRGGFLPVTPPEDADLHNLRNADRGSMLHEADEPTLRRWLIRHGFLAG